MHRLLRQFPNVNHRPATTPHRFDVTILDRRSDLAARHPEEPPRHLDGDARLVL
jgi:hypothetical protein